MQAVPFPCGSPTMLSSEPDPYEHVAPLGGRTDGEPVQGLPGFDDTDRTDDSDYYSTTEDESNDSSDDGDDDDGGDAADETTNRSQHRVGTAPRSAVNLDAPLLGDTKLPFTVEKLIHIRTVTDSSATQRCATPDSPLSTLTSRQIWKLMPKAGKRKAEQYLECSKDPKRVVALLEEPRLGKVQMATLSTRVDDLLAKAQLDQSLSELLQVRLVGRKREGGVAPVSK